MENLLSTNLLRVLVPDIALFWRTAFDGLWQMGVPIVVYALSWILVLVAFAVIIYEMLLTQSFAPITARAVRLLIVLVALSFYPSLVGGSPTTTTPPSKQPQSWVLFHRLYSSIYGGGGQKDSLYYRWLINGGKGPMAQALKDMHEGFQRLLGYKAVLTGTLVLYQGFQSVIGIACDGGVIGQVTKRAPLVSVVCGVEKQLDRALQDFDKMVSRAMANLTLSMLILMGAHALIIYSTLAIFIASVFLLPLPAALAMFKGGEKAFLTVVGLYLGSFLALGVSAVAFAAASATLYRTLGGLIKSFTLPVDKEIQASLNQAKVQIEKSKTLAATTQSLLKQLKVQKESWEGYYTSVLSQGVDEGGAIMVGGNRPWWGVTYRTVGGSWVPEMVTPITPSNIAFGVGKIEEGGSEPYLSVSVYECPGTTGAKGERLNPEAFTACFSEMGKAISSLENQLNDRLTGNVLASQSLMDKMTAPLLRINLLLTINVAASIVLASVLASAMVLLTTRIASIVQGFNLGSGVALPR